MSLLVVGPIAYDEIETPFGKSGKILGGPAPYIVFAASLLDVDSGMISIIGEDFKDTDYSLFTERKIDLSGVEKVNNGKTFHWVGKYHLDMNSRDTLATNLNVLEEFKPIVPTHLKKAKVVVLGNLHPKMQLDVINQLDGAEITILDTMNYWIDNTWEDLLKVLKKIDVLTINDEEARQISGEYSLKKAANKILQLGPRFLIIKKGEHGAILFHKDQMFFAPALPLEEVFDPTGAGDTFAGGFAGYLTKNPDYSFDNMKCAVIFGSALASFTVEKYGVQRLLEIDREQIAQRIKQFKQLTHFNFKHNS